MKPLLLITAIVIVAIVGCREKSEQFFKESTDSDSVFLEKLKTKSKKISNTVTFKSNYLVSGAGTVDEKHTIQFKEGITENDCDTLLIDNFKIFCLHHGENGEEIKPGTNKFRYYANIVGIKNTKYGRVISGPNIPNNLDYDTRIELWHTGEEWQRPMVITEVIVRIHGMITGYYK